jgi:dihydrolipoamide dehydrogenase
VFTDPQIGSVGLTESECRNRGLSYRTAKTEYGSIAKGQIVGSPPGFAKLIVEEETDRILGFHMVGPNSADLVHEVVVAMTASGAGEGPSARGWHLGSKRFGGEGRGDRAEGGLTAQIIRDTIHTHPTLAELVKQVFDEAM